MNKYFTTLTNERGDVLPNYRMQVVDSAGSTVTIYADNGGTRFTDASGNIINYATASANGRVSFYFTAAEGQVLQTLDSAGDLVDSEADFADNFVLANLSGNIAQSAVTDLTADLAAKADDAAATAALATKTAIADLASTATGKGSALVGFKQAGTGAVTRTVEAKAKDTISVKDFGADPANADNTAAIQAALTYAGTVAPATVIADQGQYNTDEVEVPTGVTFRCDLKLRVGATVGTEKNIVLVNSGCTVIGKLEGTNVTATEVVERGIFTAGNDIADVVLDVTVTKTTVGVQATCDNLTLPPRRWSGTIRCVDIAGLVPAVSGNGYGLNATMCDSNITLFCKNVPRHGLYLAAGASNNNIEFHDDGGRFAPFDIAALDGQPECYGNVVRAFIRNHLANYTGLSHYGGFISGNCRANVIEVHITESAPLTAAFYMQANSTTAFPIDNHVTVFFDGEIKGVAVADINSTTGTRLKVFGTGAGANTDFRGIVYVGSNGFTPATPRAVTCEIEAIDFVCTAEIDHAVIVITTYGRTDLGKGCIKATGFTGDIVNPAGALAFIDGWIYETNFVGTTGVIASGATGGLAVTFNNSLPTRRYISYSVAPLADPGSFAPNHYIQPILDGSCTIKVKNNDTGDQNFIVSGRAYGF